MEFADGTRERAPLRGYLDPLGNSLVECIEALVQRGSRYFNFVVLAGVERP